VNNNDLSLSNRKIRFSASLTGQRIDLDFGTLELKNDVYINGTGRNITITRGGLFVAGRLIKVDEGTTAIIEGLELTGGNIGGGAIESYGDLTVQNCKIHDNVADDGAAIAAWEDTLTVLNCEIYDNQAIDEGQGRGGGILIESLVTEATITNTWIYDNTADDKGGGVYIVGGDPEEEINTTVTLNNDWIFENDAVNRGGGVGVGSAASPQLLLTGNTLIEENSATAVDSKGGGVYLGAGTVTYNAVTIANNEANAGDGLFLAGGANTVGTGVTWINNSQYSDD
jgi:hypothetical protein